MGLTRPLLQRARPRYGAAAAAASGLLRGALPPLTSLRTSICSGSVSGAVKLDRRSPLSATAAAATALAAHSAPRRFQSSSSAGGGGSGFDDGADDHDGLHSELSHALAREGSISVDAAIAQPLVRADLQTPSARIRLEKVDRPPSRFDLLTNSLVYRWMTTAAQARKVSGPMREWAAELKYRTGVHLEVEPTYPERLALTPEEGGYTTADEVELTVYLFGTERGVFNCRQLMETALDQDPAYVRLAVFRRKPGQEGSDAVEWLTLRRINRDLRPPDIPPISLKTPGKWTLLYEHYKEAAIRSLWEETGIAVNAAQVYPTAVLHQSRPLYYWRVPVHYFIAEVPYDVQVLGPQVALNSYMHQWDNGLLRQSPDPIDRAWSQLADPETGCAWMKRAMLDELQKPLRGENYMATRYTPPPYSELNEVLGLALPADEGAAASATAAAAAETGAPPVAPADAISTSTEDKPSS